MNSPLNNLILKYFQPIQRFCLNKKRCVRHWVKIGLCVICAFIFLIYAGNVYRKTEFVKNTNQFIEDKILNTGYTTGIIIDNLDISIDEIFSANPIVSINGTRPFPAASVIKIPIMVAVYTADRSGLIDLDGWYTLKRSDITGGSGVLKAAKPGKKFQFRELIALMITRSDNTASNIFIRQLGMDFLNKTFRDAGLKDTVINRYVMDLRSREKGIDNYVSARDLSFILERIYHSDCVDRPASEEMLKFLLGQHVDDRILRYLPSGVEVAHKTGTIRGIVHDAGIVFTGRGAFTICFLTEGSSTYLHPKKLIGKISEILYYFMEYLQ